jgi:hypothetical protein
MSPPDRAHLARIGRRGGIRSRRVLTSEHARAMVAVREARRAAAAFKQSQVALASPALPGVEIVAEGLDDLAHGRETDAALLVSIAAPRLVLLGIRVPRIEHAAEERLFARLDARFGDGAHSHYNALIRRLVSFARAVPTCAT